MKLDPDNVAARSLMSDLAAEFNVPKVTNSKFGKDWLKSSDQ